MTSSSSPTSKPSNVSLPHTTNSSKLSVLGIPTSFQCLNHTITVKVDSTLVDIGRGGDYCGCTNEIRLFTHNMFPDAIIQTYYHELVHCFEHKANLAQIDSEEARCDILGGMLAQYMQTKQ